MSGLYKCEICPCCKQVITDKGRGAIEKHSETILKLYGFTLKELQVKTKTGYIVEARNYFWLLLIVEDNWSFPRAAKVTGHDHTTTMHGVRKLARELLGVRYKASRFEIVKAYWIAVGMDEESAHKKAFQGKERGR